MKPDTTITCPECGTTSSASNGRSCPACGYTLTAAEVKRYRATPPTSPPPPATPPIPVPTPKPEVPPPDPVLPSSPPRSSFSEKLDDARSCVGLLLYFFGLVGFMLFLAFTMGC